MSIKKFVILINLIILTNSSLNSLINIRYSKSSNCVADILNALPSKDVHFLIITSNEYFFPFYGFRAFQELSQANRLGTYSVRSPSELDAHCIQNHEINVYLIFINENEDFVAVLDALTKFCSWNPVAKVFILIRHYEAVGQNHVYFELFRKLIFNVIIVEISSKEQSLITVSIFFYYYVR